MNMLHISMKFDTFCNFFEFKVIITRTVYHILTVRPLYRYRKSTLNTKSYDCSYSKIAESKKYVCSPLSFCILNNKLAPFSYITTLCTKLSLLGNLKIFTVGLGTRHYSLQCRITMPSDTVVCAL